MTNFFDELTEKFKMPFSKTDGGFKVIYISSGVYIEGHCGVIDFNDNEVSFKLKKGKLSFLGENLFIKELTLDSSVISGKILKIERV